VPLWCTAGRTEGASWLHVFVVSTTVALNPDGGGGTGFNERSVLAVLLESRMSL
jgi:hypothetical protein